MPWIKEADLPDLPDIFRVLSLDTNALEVVELMNEGLAFGNSSLTRAQEEAIATVVSVANHCRYGALTHSGFFRRYSGDLDAAGWLLTDYTQANFSRKDRSMLDFAVKMTLEPAALPEREVDQLREVGFKDVEIISIVVVTCLFNFMNRVANSLGVEPPANLQRAVEGWAKTPADEESWLHPLESDPQLGVDATTNLNPILGRTLEQKSNPASPLEPSSMVVPGMMVPERECSTQPDTDSNPELRSRQEWNADPDSPSERGLDPHSEHDAHSASAEHPKLELPPKIDDAGATPTEVSLAANGNGYIADLGTENSLQMFVNDCCVVAPGETCNARDLYIAYIRWCDEHHRRPMLQRNFGLGLSGLGFRRRRRGHGSHGWSEIGLRGKNSEETEPSTPLE